MVGRAKNKLLLSPLLHCNLPCSTSLFSYLDPPSLKVYLACDVSCFWCYVLKSFTLQCKWDQTSTLSFFVKECVGNISVHVNLEMDWFPIQREEQYFWLIHTKGKL